ncbi:MAG: hypothetical protein ACXAEN_24900 [Candidatus Thorarchaeota archaeon]|jgi:hypothetical protein
MDGKEALRRLRELLDEESTGTWIDSRTSYDYLWDAAKEFASRTGLSIDTYRFETEQDVDNYELPGNFLGLFLRDRQNEFFVKYMKAGSEHQIGFKDYEDMKSNDYYTTRDIRQATCTYTDGMLRDTGQDFTDWDASTSSDGNYLVRVYQDDGTSRWAYLGTCPDTTNSSDYIIPYKNSTLKDRGWNGDSQGTIDFYQVQQKSSVTVPSHFSIRPKLKLLAQITGTATSTGAAAAGECTLTDTSGRFLSTDPVTPGDHIHNTTDGSTGVILSITSTTAIKIALFGGTNNDCSTSDAYVIQPMGRMEMILDPPPSVSNEPVELYYIKIPDPAYSDYGTYNVSHSVMEACVKYAAWMYKYRDSEPDMGDRLYVMFDREVREFDRRMKPAVKRQGFTVNFKKRR